MLLLKGGTILSHDEEDRVVPLRDTSILIEDDKITKIGKNIANGEDIEVVNCTDKIISPGFVDTHHHLWQTQLKGRHADHTLYDYMPTGNFQNHNYMPEDIYWGQLSGALESIDAGTTTVLDHAHGNRTVEHSKQALQGIIDSGIRCIFAPSHAHRFSTWDTETCQPDQDLMPEAQSKYIEEIAMQQPFGDGRVSVGFGFDNYFLPKEVVLGMFERMKKAGVKLITSHIGKTAVTGDHSMVSLLHEYGLLNAPSDLLLSHCTGLNDEEKKILVNTQTPISTTPDTEAMMALGYPLAFTPGINYTFGVDTHATNTSSILSQARSALAMARQETTQALIAEGNFPLNLRGSSLEAFNAATINGARALGLGAVTGSIQVGKSADLVIFDATSVSMACAAEYDPLVAVLRHSDIRDIEDVIIGGRWRKRKGKLIDVKCHKDGKTLAWMDIRQRLLESQRGVEERIGLVSVDRARSLMEGMWGVDRDLYEIVDR